jgi:hypothetical protein
MQNLNEDQLKVIRETIAQKLAEEICSVQPMPNNLIADLIKVSKSPKELKAEGYEPVSNLGLMWIKK